MPPMEPEGTGTQAFTRGAAYRAAALAAVTPATQALSFIYGQELLVRLGLVRLVGAVDRSVDLSQERFHDEYYDPLELQVQCASLMSVIALAPAFLWVAVRCNEGMPLRALLQRAVYAFFWGTVAALVTVILFGAPVVTAAHKTFAFSMILGGIPAMPLGCTLGSDVRVWQRVLSHNDIRGAAEFQFWIPAAAAVVGAWVGAFPIPLDWDRPWQVMWREKAWPITCTAGTICGHNIGLISAAVYLFLQARAAEMKSGPGKGGGVGGGVGSGSNRGRSPRRKKD